MRLVALLGLFICCPAAPAATLTDRPAGAAKPFPTADSAPASVKDFGAVGNGAASDQAAVANAVGSGAFHGRYLLFPATGAPAGTPYYRLSAPLDVPRYNGQVFSGMGRRASRLYQDTAGEYVLRANHDWARGSTNGGQVRDLWLSGKAGTGGFQMIGLNRSDVLFSRIDVPGVGIYNKDALVVRLIGNELDGNSVGFLNDGTGPNTGPNNYNWLGNYVSNASEYGISTYSAWAWNFGGNGLEGNRKGGLRITDAGGAIASYAGYYEENHHGNTGGATFDVYAGVSSYVRGVRHFANYHNGRVLRATYDYCPIRVGYGDGQEYAYNLLVTGNRFFCFERGALLTNSFFGPQAYVTTGPTPVDLSDPGTIYRNVPSNLLTLRTRINDPAVVPTDGQNLLSGTFPYAWTAALGAGSAFTASSDSLNGQPTAALVRTTGTAQISRNVAVSATSNSRVRNRYTSFCAELQVTDAAQKNVVMSFADGTTTASQTYALGRTDGQKRHCVSMKVNASAAALTLTLEMSSNNGTVLLAAESLFVGMDYDAAPQYAGTPAPFMHDLAGSSTYDPPNIAPGATIVAASTVRVNGAAVGDTCLASHSDNATANADKVEFRCKVSARDTATVYVSNWHSAGVDLVRGTLRVRVLKQ